MASSTTKTTSKPASNGKLTIGNRREAPARSGGRKLSSELANQIREALEAGNPVAVPYAFNGEGYKQSMGGARNAVQAIAPEDSSFELDRGTVVKGEFNTSPKGDHLLVVPA